MLIRRNFYVYALVIALLGAFGCGAPSLILLRTAATRTPTPTRTPAPTFTATPTLTSMPSAQPPTETATPTLTATPAPTFTPSAQPPIGTETPTSAPTATDTPLPSPTATRKPRPPTDTPTPTVPPTPSVDFKLVSWKLWPLELNGGCWGEGMHEIFVHVLDVTGAPLDGVVVGDTWNNVELATGLPGKPPGVAVIDLWANGMQITVKRDQATGQPYTSEVSPLCDSFAIKIPIEQLMQAGYCAGPEDCRKKQQENLCAAHYSWELVFQKTH
jgi:hypothetical protein